MFCHSTGILLPKWLTKTTSPLPIPSSKVWTEFLKGKIVHLHFAVVIFINMPCAFGLVCPDEFLQYTPPALAESEQGLNSCRIQAACSHPLWDSKCSTTRSRELLRVDENSHLQPLLITFCNRNGTAPASPRFNALLPCHAQMRKRAKDNVYDESSTADLSEFWHTVVTSPADCSFQPLETISCH